MGKRTLIGIIFAFIFFVITSSGYCQQASVKRINNTVSKLTNFSFTKYKYWSVIQRSKRAYVFDYSEAKHPIRLFLETNKKDDFIDISYTLSDTLFAVKLSDCTETFQGLGIDWNDIIELFNVIIDLEIKRFHYIKEYDGYMFDFEKYTAIFSPTDVTKVAQFINYKALNKNGWYYYIAE